MVRPTCFESLEKRRLIFVVDIPGPSQAQQLEARMTGRPEFPGLTFEHVSTSLQSWDTECRLETKIVKDFKQALGST